MNLYERRIQIATWIAKDEFPAAWKDAADILRSNGYFYSANFLGVIAYRLGLVSDPDHCKSCGSDDPALAFAISVGTRGEPERCNNEFHNHKDGE